MARRTVFKEQHITNAGVPFTARLQYDPDYREYRACCFTAACSQQIIEDRAFYSDDKEDAIGTLRHMTQEFKENHSA